MRKHRVAAVLAAISMLAGMPGAAQAMSGAEKLRRLDIMLMVTGLRCRTGADNFQADYARFTGRHLQALNAASDSMKRELAARHGPAGAVRALDRLSVVMANTYGQGHPWLSCRELKMVARNLAEVRGTDALEAAADQLLANRGSAQMAVLRR
jgi:hypothetical protein